MISHSSQGHFCCYSDICWLLSSNASNAEVNCVAFGSFVEVHHALFQEQGLKSYPSFLYSQEYLNQPKHILQSIFHYVYRFSDKRVNFCYLDELSF